jgi:hypothetical protein
MTDRTGSDYFFVFAGNAIKRTEILGARHFARRIEAGGGKHASATWIVVAVVTLSSLVLGLV